MKKELYLVKRGLEKRKVQFETEPLFDGHEIKVRNLSGEVAFSVLYYSHSFGNKEGLLEVDGVLSDVGGEALPAKEVLSRVDTWLEEYAALEVEWWEKEQRKEVK